MNGNSRIDEQLFKAAGHCDVEQVASLIKNGANVNTRDNDSGDTPLMEAAADYMHTGHGAEVVKLLLEAGAKIDCKNDNGWTPFFKALRWQRLAVAKLLIDAGAKVNLKDYENKTAWQYCAPEIGKEMKNYIANRHTLASAEKGADNCNGYEWEY